LLFALYFQLDLQVFYWISKASKAATKVTIEKDEKIRRKTK
jgi:hypothetical protein